MISLLLMSLIASAQTSTNDQVSTPYQMCVESCQAWTKGPGWELRQCLDECTRMHMPKPVYTMPVGPMDCPEERQTAAEGGLCI